MRFLALASDYDGTLAHDGDVDDETIKALERVRQSGRKLILVTGRELPDLENVFSRLDLFNFVVAENGALLFNPATRSKTLLAPAPPENFVNDLKQRGVQGLSVGEAIVATWHPHEAAVLESIRQLGLELQVIFNKDAVMILPSGVNKMTGLARALEEMKLSRHNVVAVGDAENDHAFLGCCECSVAVSNAIPALKEKVDWVTDKARGEGVAELVDRLLSDDLASLHFQLQRHGILLGRSSDGDIFFDPNGKNLLLCGQSGSGKSTFVAGFIERLVERGYQTCVIDPEGDYEALADFFTVGDESHPPSLDQIFQLLDHPDSNLSINLIGVKMHDRPAFFSSLLSRLQEKFLQEGRPHWLIVDEAHHLLPCEWAPASAEVAGEKFSMMLVTVHPEHVSPAALRLIDAVAIVGKAPQEVAGEFAKVAGVGPPQMPPEDLLQGEASVWFLDSNRVFTRFRSEPGKAERKRHKRKYAEGELEAERMFWFRGPEGKLNLRVQNLNTFLQIAEGIDDETWLFHLRRGDYSNWFQYAIKDEYLASEIKEIEQASFLSAVESRGRVAKAIETRYTVPV
ncbi:MAG: HAD-IIB family hydrolase [Acidobacteriaceae bacterium]|nr:HAD-IIB family hydrolase [Acidobacteriaceae bacterium]